MRKLVLTVLLISISTGVYSLGLGNIELSSGLNQPFEARIELLTPTSTELDSLNIRIADIEAFSRAGIEWTIILNSLNIEVEINDTGSDYILITSSEAIREPFLNFLLDASWSSGRLFREYTVLLDPPLYDPNVGSVSSPATAIPNGVSETTSRSSVSGGASQSRSQFTGSASYSGDEFGPVRANDTLWSIASQVRPDSSTTVQQMMMALLRAYPEAFIANNINGLRLGQILRIPDQDEIQSVSVDAAFADVSSQNSLWEEIRSSFAGNATQRPASSPGQPSSNNSSPSAALNSELRLVAPGNQSTGGGQGSSSIDSTGPDSADIALASEQIETLSSENNELKSRLNESEELIQDLRRLIGLTDDELSAIQQQVVAGDDQTNEQIMEEESVQADNEIESVEDQVDIVEETISSLDLTDTGDEMPDHEAVESTDDVAIPPAAATQTENITTDGGIVDQILRFVFANIMLVGGALGAVILGIVGFLFIRKKSEATSDDFNGEITATEFPDFDSSADEQEIPENLAEMEKDEEENLDKRAFIDEVESEELSNDIAEVEAIAPAEPVVAEEPEDDPLAEVNVFLAYEHFDQAEEFVRDAISNDPENLDFHSKLLEVFYSSGDKSKYEEEAKVLNELVSGEVPHWEMAQIMWQEISPNRGLFAEPIDGDVEEGDSGEAKGGGIVDLTADDDEGDDDGALDFDLGMGGAESLDDNVLDITGDVSSQSTDEDLLDVTAAVGLDTVGNIETAEDEVFEIDTADSEDEQDILDISVSAAADEDLLDVTSQTSEVEADEGESLLDVTTAIDNSEGDEELPDLSVDQELSSTDDNSLDFDIGGLDIEVGDGEETSNISNDNTSEDNLIEFESAPSSDNAEDELEISLEDSDEDSGIALDFDSQNSTDSDVKDGLEITLDDFEEDGGVELELGNDSGVVDEADDDFVLLIDDDDSLDINFEIEDDQSSNELSLDADIEIDNAVPEIDLDSTVEFPKDIELNLDDDDDDDDHTVFVPRTADASKQSAEDEIATKLDLAKAYVELGDKESAGTILDEIIAEGNDSQRQQAEDLKGQIT